MGNNEAGTNYGPIGSVVVDDASGVRSVVVDQIQAASFLGGEQVYAVEPELYELTKDLVEEFKAEQAKRYEPSIDDDVFIVRVGQMRAIERFMDAAGRTSPLADRAQELYLSGRADERWIKVAQPWQIGAAFANPTVACILHLTKDGYAAALAAVSNAAW